MLRILFAATIGAVAEYLLDPDKGKRRRAMLRDRFLATARRTSKTAARKARYAASTASGITQRVAHMSTEKDEPAPDDATLSHKVESELFRDPQVPKGKINVSAEYGVVVLRGQVDDPEEITTLESKVWAIDGVHGVENLLHLPNTLTPGASAPVGRSTGAKSTDGSSADSSEMATAEGLASIEESQPQDYFPSDTSSPEQGTM